MIAIFGVNPLTVENLIGYFNRIINPKGEKDYFMRSLQKIRLEILKIIYRTTAWEQHVPQNSVGFIT